LQEITFELYNDDVPAYKAPEQLKSIEEILMFEILHATWIDKHWVAYTLNNNLLGTYKVGQPAMLDNGTVKKLFFIAAFPGSVGGLDLYMAEYSNGNWGKPRNLGNTVNTTKNESNPGLLNDHTLTYSSGGIIKKLDLNTFKVVDLEEAANETVKPVKQKTVNTLQISEDTKKDDVIAAIGDNSTASPTANTDGTANDYGAIGDNSTATPLGSTQDQLINKSRIPQDQQELKVKEKKETIVVTTPQKVTAPAQIAEVSAPKSVTNAASNLLGGVVESVGPQSRDDMLMKYQTAIQLGAFTSPNWNLFNQLSKFGKLVTYKNEKNMYVVWITGFVNRTAAEEVLPQVKSIAGFENAYVTGK
jgi:hypothetical protein